MANSSRGAVSIALFVASYYVHFERGIEGGMDLMDVVMADAVPLYHCTTAEMFFATIRGILAMQSTAIAHSGAPGLETVLSHNESSSEGSRSIADDFDEAVPVACCTSTRLSSLPLKSLAESIITWPMLMQRDSIGRIHWR